MELRVYLNRDAWQSGATCYVRQIDLSDCVSDVYSILLSSMRLLYGNACVVDFIVMPKL